MLADFTAKPCPHCGQTELVVLEGPDLEPICIDCLAKIDPARAAVLARIKDLRK